MAWCARLINEHDVSLLAVGTSDGVVRLWQDYAAPKPVLLTAWRAVSHMRKGNEGQGAGLIVAWEQRTGQLFASGDVPYIQVGVCGCVCVCVCALARQCVCVYLPVSVYVCTCPSVPMTRP